jgi:hypothetical protein
MPSGALAGKYARRLRIHRHPWWRTGDDRQRHTLHLDPPRYPLRSSRLLVPSSLNLTNTTEVRGGTFLHLGSVPVDTSLILCFPRLSLGCRYLRRC